MGRLRIPAKRVNWKQKEIRQRNFDMCTLWLNFSIIIFKQWHHLSDEDVKSIGGVSGSFCVVIGFSAQKAFFLTKEAQFQCERSLLFQHSPEQHVGPTGVNFASLLLSFQWTWLMRSISMETKSLCNKLVLKCRCEYIDGFHNYGSPVLNAEMSCFLF